MKDYIKSAVSLVLSAMLSYAGYLLLWALNIIHVYEFSDWSANIPCSIAITILCIIFNFIFGYIFKPNMKRCIILQGTYLLISAVMIFFLGGIANDFVAALFSIIGFPNLILYFWSDISEYTDNLAIIIIVYIVSAGLPLLASVAGILARQKKEKSQLTKTENNDIMN